MNFALLDNIDALDGGFLATIVTTSGHTYQKAGARALFRSGQPFPHFGNLGALCADRELADQGARALVDGLPRIVRIDTTSPEDARIGYGTSCGGMMEVLIEPIISAQRDVYRELRRHLEGTSPVFLVHNTKTGALSVATDQPASADDIYVERIAPPRRVHLFGATPLAAALCAALAGTRFDVHVTDWRSSYLEQLTEVPASRRHLGELSVAPQSYVVILSHSFERDRAALRHALDCGCRFVGMLSSTPRRDQMFEELAAAGVDPGQLKRVASPVGIGARGQTDAEIAIAIAAQLLEVDGP